MEFRELSTFLQVAKLQSFSKAAKVLGYSQAAVTIQIKQLEQELGAHLFDRAVFFMNTQPRSYGTWRRQKMLFPIPKN